MIADIKTFTAFGCFATAAVTSLTYQNTTGVFGAAHQTAAAVRAQIVPVLEDFEVAGVKTGMLPTEETIKEVARLFRESALPAPIVDPVVRSTSGYDLIDDQALTALIEELMPLAALITPNIPEAERITNMKINDLEDMERAARRMREMGARAVLIKGGHALTGEAAVDVLDQETIVTRYSSARIKTTSTHGTGCTLAAAITACLARGEMLARSVEIAKRFVTAAILQAPRLGHGNGPVEHNVEIEVGG